jgi:transposase
MRNVTPLQVRRAILRARARGLTYVETASLLGIGIATVSRVLRQHRETRRLEPRPIRGGNYSPLAGDVAKALVGLVGELPDATVAELTTVLMGRTDVSTSRPAVQRALVRLGFTRKKSPSSRRSATRRRTGSTGGSSAPDSSR